MLGSGCSKVRYIATASESVDSFLSVRCRSLCPCIFPQNQCVGNNVIKLKHPPTVPFLHWLHCLVPVRYSITLSLSPSPKQLSLNKRDNVIIQTLFFSFCCFEPVHFTIVRNMWLVSWFLGNLEMGKSKVHINLFFFFNHSSCITLPLLEKVSGFISHLAIAYKFVSENEPNGSSFS